MKRTWSEVDATITFLVVAAFAIAGVVSALPPNVTRTSQPARDVTVQAGWVPFGQPIPIELETRSAIWYEREGSGVRWVQSPATIAAPAHAMMGVRYEPAGAESLLFEDHPRGVLAVVPSRDARP